MEKIENPLTTALSRAWWVLMLRGAAAIAFGLLTWFQPKISLATLVLLFGIYAVADGGLAIWTALSGRREHDHWWLLLLRGVVGVAAGSLAFVAPGITALALLFYIAVWALATGVLEIALAIRLRKEIQGEWLLILAGLAAVLFGYFLLARPGEGALALLRTIAVFSVFFGGIFVLLGFKMRRFVKRMTPR